jgi:hypothetical protein
MKLTIELDRETDGRWIAEVPELNVLLYGESRQDAIQEFNRPRGRLYLIGLPTANCLPIRSMPYSTSPHEFLAFGEGSSCIRRA